MKMNQPYNFYNNNSPPKNSPQFKNLTIIKEEENQRRMSKQGVGMIKPNSFNSPKVRGHGSRRGKDIIKTKSRLKTQFRSPGNRDRDNNLISPKHEISLQYSNLNQKRGSVAPNPKIASKLFDKSPEIERGTRNNSNNRNIRHNISYNITDGLANNFSPPPLNQSQNRSRIRDDPGHSNSLMKSPIQRDSGMLSPKQMRNGVKSPLFGRRATNYNPAIPSIKNHFSLHKTKVIGNNQRKSRVQNPAVSSKFQINRLTGNFANTFIEGNNNELKSPSRAEISRDVSQSLIKCLTPQFI